MEREGSDKAFNGIYWECYIFHRQFHTSSALTDHTNSTFHQQQVYHCPNKKPNARNSVSLWSAFFRT